MVISARVKFNLILSLLLLTLSLAWRGMKLVYEILAGVLKSHRTAVACS